MVYVWHVDDGHRPEIYAPTYAESLAFLEASGKTVTKSWVEGKGSWSVSDPGEPWLSFLVPYRITPDRWRERIHNAIGLRLGRTGGPPSASDGRFHD
mgnify:CR=1 FL=1